MNTLNRTFLVLLAAVALCSTADAQATLTQTTLAGAVTTTSGKTISLTSCTGIAAPNPYSPSVGGATSSQLYIDTEMLDVQATSAATGACQVTVRRGATNTRAQTHSNGATVYANPSGVPTSVTFFAYPLWGSCTATNMPVLPIIDYVDQYVENCVNSQWVLLISGTVNFPQTLVLAADYTNATTTFSTVFPAGIPVHAGLSYTLRCDIIWQGSASTTGPKYEFTGPASPTKVASNAISAVTASTFTQASATALSTGMANAGTITTATNFHDVVTLGFVNGANAGTLQLLAAANGAGTLTIKAGSYCVQQ